ncbi:MAG: threonine-phosphate decarboxylase [Desulfobacterales bacterium]
MIEGHGGNIRRLAEELGCEPADITDMSSNVNPMGPPPGLRDYLRENMDLINILPDADSGSAVRAFSRRYDLNPGQVLAGNGSTQFIYFLPLALASRHVLIVGPTYADYADACAMHGIAHDFLFAEPEREFQPDVQQIADAAAEVDTVFLCNPDNPTGALISRPVLRELCESLPQTRFIIDESYLPFVKEETDHSMMHCGLSNVIMLSSMSKIFRIPGLRIGFLIAPPDIIRKMNRYALPWSVNTLALHAVVWLMEHQEIADRFVAESRDFLEAERKNFFYAMKGVSSVRLFPSCTSFVLAELKGAYNSGEICAALAREKILIRNCANFRGLSDRFIRISLKTSAINRMLAEKLRSVSQ